MLQGSYKLLPGDEESKFVTKLKALGSFTGYEPLIEFYEIRDITNPSESQTSDGYLEDPNSLLTHQGLGKGKTPSEAEKSAVEEDGGGAEPGSSDESLQPVDSSTDDESDDDGVGSADDEIIRIMGSYYHRDDGVGSYYETADNEVGVKVHDSSISSPP